MFYYIEPEVAGGLGDDTIMDTSAHPPLVSELNYCFEGWLGDDLLETFPCYIVTERMKHEIESQSLSGVQFDSVKISVSDQFLEMYPNKVLPNFFWLKIDGVAGVDSFGMEKDHRLVISEEALKVMQRLNISNADLENHT